MPDLSDSEQKTNSHKKPNCKTKTMKKTLITTAIVIAGFACLSTARAQQFTQNNAQYGDLMIGFENSGGGGATNLVIDLGSVGLISGAGLESINGLNISSDLTACFGSTWTNGLSVSYGLFSVTANRAIYASGAVGAGAYPVEPNSTQNAVKNSFSNLLGNFNSDGRSSQTTTYGVYELTSESGTTWSAATPYNGMFTDADYGNIESPISSTEEIYAQAPGSIGTYGTDTGVSIEVGTNGVITAVPEPSTYALFGLGALLLLVAYRRRANS